MTDTKNQAGTGSEGDAGTQDKGSKGAPDSGSSDGETKKQLDAANAKIAELIEDRNTWKSKFRDSEKAKDDASKDKANKEGDIEAIKTSYEKELGTQKDLVSKLTGQLHKEIALGALRRASNGKVVSISQIEALFGDKITIHEEGDTVVAAIKDASGKGIRYEAGKPMSIEKFLDELAAIPENQNLFLSTRKGGTGANGAGNASASDGKIPTITELLAMPDKGAAWIAANPDKLAKVNTSALKLTTGG